jgi:hypothetical protein
LQPYRMLNWTCNALLVSISSLINIRSPAYKEESKYWDNHVLSSKFNRLNPIYNTEEPNLHHRSIVVYKAKGGEIGARPTVHPIEFPSLLEMRKLGHPLGALPVLLCEPLIPLCELLIPLCGIP